MSERIFDAQASRLAAEEAIGRVAEHAEPDFMLAALEAVHRVASTTAEFTTNRIWWELDRAKVDAPREPRALGPVMRIAQSHGWIEDTFRVKLTEQPSAHRRPIRIWRSRLVTT